MKKALRPSLDWLLIFVVAAAVLRLTGTPNQLALFCCSCLGIIPLAKWLGEATEHLAERTGEGVGGLLNATFGNAAELIIAIAALHKGLYTVVKASLLGSVIGNLLLVLGASLLSGGLRFSVLRYNPTAARAQASMLLLAAVGLVAPAAFRLIEPGAAESELRLSWIISGLLLVLYVLGLVFSLRTHKQLFTGGEQTRDEEDTDDQPWWSLRKALTILGVSTAFTAWMSEILAGSVEPAAESLGMNRVFIGVIVVAIVGNAAEHSTAIMMALKNKMDLTIGIAIGSSVQIATFVAPLCVLLSLVVGPRPMDLVFTGPEILALLAAVAITAQTTSDGESTWFQGAQMLAVYTILGCIFYFLPEAAGAVSLHR